MAAALAGPVGVSFPNIPLAPKPASQVSLPLRVPDKPQNVAPSKKILIGNSESNQILNENISNEIHQRKSGGRAVAPACSTSDVLRLMDALCLPVPVDMYTSFVKECTVSASSCEADYLHAHITKAGLDRPSVSLLNRLLLMHVSHRRLDVARELFDGMPLKDFKSWAVMIVVYGNRGDYQEAVSLFMKMVRYVCMLEFPAWFMVCLLKMCVCTTDMDFGKQVHACCLKLGHSNNSFIASCLINFYGKFKSLESANMVFNQLPYHGVPTLMARLINNSREQCFSEVFWDFKEIGEAGIKKNASMFSIVLKACAKMHDNGQCGRQVHANAIKLGLESDSYVQCGLVEMYGGSCLLGDAKKVFLISRNRRNSVCWNAMLRGYIRNEFYLEAIKFVYEMKGSGVQLQQPLLDELRIACGSNCLGKLHLMNGVSVL